MENNSHAEHIANRVILSFEVLKIDYFRGYITRSSASHEKILF